MLLFRTPLPYDRHDWTVDRCGKEVEYVIDYYAVPFRVESTQNTNNSDTSDEKVELNKRDTRLFKQENENENSINMGDSIEYVSKNESSTRTESPGNHIDDDNVEYIYTIDARPKLNSIGNAFDRMRMSFNLWRKGESWM